VNCKKLEFENMILISGGSWRGYFYGACSGFALGSWLYAVPIANVIYSGVGLTCLGVGIIDGLTS